MDSPHPRRRPVGRGHLHGPRDRVQRRLLGARRAPRLAHRTAAARVRAGGLHCRRRRRRRPDEPVLGEALRERGVRQPRAHLGLPRRHAGVGRGGRARGARGLGARRRVGAEYRPPEELYRDGVAGPHGACVTKDAPGAPWVKTALDPSATIVSPAGGAPRLAASRMWCGE